MRDDTIVVQATAKEIIHEDVEMLRRFGAAFLTVVFELPLSDVTVVDGGKAVLECRRGHVACRQRRTDGYQIVFTADGWCHLIIRDVMLKDEAKYTVRAVNEAGSR